MNAPIPRTPVEAEDEFRFREFFFLLSERARMIGLCLGGSVFLFVLLGLCYLLVAPPVYRSSTIVEIPQHALYVVNFENIDDGDFRREDVIKTIEQKFQRISLFRKVMDREEIKSNSSLQHWLRKPIDEYQANELATILADWTRVNLKYGTRLITIAVEHRDPFVAKELADAIVEEYLRENSRTRQDVSRSAFEFLQSEAERARIKLKESRSDLLEFQKHEKALVLFEMIKEQKNLISQMSLSHADNHPILVQARDRLAELVGHVQVSFEPKPRSIGGDSDLIAEPDAKDVELDLDPWLEVELKLLEARSKVIARELDEDREIYYSLLGRMKETDVLVHMDVAPFQIVEPAYVPLEPSKPNGPQIIGFSVVVGAGFGLGILWVLLAVDSSLGSVQETKRIIGLPALGVIPDDRRLRGLRSLDGPKVRTVKTVKEESEIDRESGIDLAAFGPLSKRQIHPLVTLSDPVCDVSESIRALRAAFVISKERSSEPLSILVTSARRGEGKSLVAANLAVAFAAEPDQRTLLVDANMRNPCIDKIFGVAPENDGFFSALVETSDWHSLVVASGIPRLDLMVCEQSCPDTDRLLCPASIARLFKGLGERYDRIVIDSAAVNSFADGLLIAPNVESVVLVIRAGTTPREEVLLARDRLTGGGCSPAGFVFNGLRRRSHHSNNPSY